MAESAGLNSDFVLGMTHNLGLLDFGDRRPPLVAIFNALDELQPTYIGPYDPLQVVGTARKASFPLIGRLEFSRLPEYMKMGIPLGIIFAEGDAERRALAEELRDVAWKSKGQVNFATADAQVLGFLAAPLGLKPGQFPAFVLQTRDDAFPFDQRREITSSAIGNFILKAMGLPHRPEKEL